MAQSRIFVSHSGDESAVALQIAEALRDAGLEPVLDRETLHTGASFLSFMEKALSTSDYCLLLWSASAAERQWVQVEWEAALQRSVTEARSFLVVGRLDGHPLPVLLRPRLYVVLHPNMQPGLAGLIKTWRDDRTAEKESLRPVASVSGLDAAEGPKQDPIYITSDLFGITCPWAVDLDTPAGVVLDDVRRRLELPDALDHKGRVGVRFEYHLGLGDDRLERGQPLSAQGVKPKSVLWIESEMRPFAAAGPAKGELAPAVFRGLGDGVGEARQYLLSWIDGAGLGHRAPRRGQTSV